VFDVHLDVVAHVQVEEAVAVEVAPGAAGSEMRVGQAGPGRHIDEVAAAAAVRLVVVQRHAAEPRDDQVVVAVVIEVADGAAQAVAGAVEPHLGRDVGERAVAVVAVQLAGGGGGGGVGPDRAVLDAE
jgi:hypothetical protein